MTDQPGYKDRARQQLEYLLDKGVDVDVFPKGNEHIIQLSSVKRHELIEFLKNPNGSFRVTERLLVEACGGGVLVRSRSYTSKST